MTDNTWWVNVHLSRQLTKYLKEVGKKDETYDQIIRRLLALPTEGPISIPCPTPGGDAP